MVICVGLIQMLASDGRDKIGDGWICEFDDKRRTRERL